MGTRLFTLVAALLCCGLAWGQPDAGGCTDIAACNYDSSATIDDGTCTFPGCTDASACNYDASAGCDDSSCVLPDATGACDCFLDCAADLTIECGDSVDPENTGSPIVSGGCDGEAGLAYFDEVSGDDCEQVITRTWSLFFEDQPIAECVQIITVVDSEGPVFLETPEDITVECVEDVPAPAECIAEDACTSVVDTEIFTSETGTPLDSCELVTAIGPGPDWSIWLPLGSDVAPSPYWSFSEVGYFITYDDGTAHLYGDVVNNGDAALGLYLDIWFENAADWTTWSDLGRWYKDDLGLAAAGGNLWETWTYYELVNGFSTVTGTSGLSGTVELYHMPADYFFGFQCGEAANVKNGNEGLSGWFTFEGTMNGMDVSGNGDINVDKECVEIPLSTCPNDNEFTYFWRAEDACGNASIISQTITVEDTTAPEVLNCPEDITVECDALDTLPDADEQTAGIEAIDNCDNSTVTVTYEGEFPGEGMAGDCEYTLLRRWRVEDECDNFTICVQTITVQDTTAPEFTLVPEDATYECDQEVAFMMAEATDNCGEVTITYEDEIIEGDCPQEYTIIRTFTAADDCDNAATATQTITVQDTTAPVFDDYPVTLTVDCGDLDSVEPLTATDNCDEEVTIEVETTYGSGGCPGTIIYEYTATDDCGNSTSATQYVNLTDTEAPVINNPEDMMIECDEVGDLPDPNAIEVTDNCDEEVTVTFEETITDGFCEDQYTITWTWTAEDDCENVATATTTITVMDTTAPTWVEGTLPADVTVECSDELPAVAMPEAEDNCDDEVEIEVTEEIIPGDCPNNYVIQRIYRGFDNCGNQVMYVQEITVQDTTAPELEIAEDVTVECDEEIPAAAWEASDNCSEVLTEEVTEVIVDGDCPNNYTIERTYSVTDECGNNTSATQIITVQDTTAPELEIAADVTIECDQEVPAPVWTASDNCSDDLTEEVTEVMVEGDCPNNYTIERTYSVTDECGNNTSATQIITVQDTTAPELEIAEDVTIECDQEVPAPVWTASDNCSEELTEEVTEVMVEGDCPNNYTIERTYSVTDACGNNTAATQIITVQDTTAPSLEIAEDVTIECDQDVPAAAWEASDNCSEELTEEVTEVMVDGDCPNNYTIERTYSVTDECGNNTSATQIITVQDTTAPELEIAADVTIECDQDVPAAAWEASDNCSEELTEEVTEVIVDGDCPNNYTIERTYSVTDECGNNTSATQIITVQDTTAPELAVAEDVTIECDEDVPAAAWEASDNCSEELTEEVSEEIVAGDCPNNYTIVRTYTVTDECGNATSAVQNITVQDTTAPTLEVADDVTVECSDELPAPEWTSADNCGDTNDEVSEEIIEGECPQEYTLIRTYTVTDLCGNSTSATQTITVVDTTAPVIEAEAFLSMPCDMIDDSVLATATDNCDEEVELTYEDTSVSGGCAGNVLREYTAVDDCGNTTSFTQVISLIDETAPEASDVPADVTVECDEEIPGGEPTFSDNCDEELDVTYEETVNELDCFYEIVQCWTAVDHCDNATTVCRTITVTDTTAPELEVAADLDLDCNDEIPAAAWEASDNCDEDLEEMVSEEIIEGNCAANYTLVRTYTVTDDCGNSTSMTQTITVSDTTAPSLEVAADVTIECDEDVPAADWTASDDCSDITEEVTEEMVEGDCPNNYTIVRTYTVTDACGNTTSAVQNITVQDTTAPTLEVADDVTVECSDELPAPEWTSADNCGDTNDEVSEEIIEGECPQEYTLIRTYTVTDLCGNSTSATQTITVVDTTAPVIEAEAFLSMPCDMIDDSVLATATDNCDEEVELTYEDTSVSGGCAGNILREYTAVDDCGNTTSFTQVISLIDETAPEASDVPADVTVECDEEIPGGEPTFSDNCDEELDVTYEETVNELDCFYEIVQCWTAVDHCDNATTVCRTITVTDTTAPELEVAADLDLDCNDEIPAAAWEASDNCDEDLEEMVSEEIIEGNCAANYTLVRTYTVTDDCGNSTSMTQTITVSDTTAPSLEVAADVTIECDEDVPAADWTASDDCSDITEEVSEEIIPGDCPVAYTLVRTYTVTDACGNTTSAVQNITVLDTTAPELEIAADVTIECDQEVPAAAWTASDNCSEITEEVSEEIIEGECAQEYTLIRTYTVTDDCGNSTSATQTITVVDTTAPVIDGEEFITMPCDDIDEAFFATATDNCDEEVELTYEDTSVSGGCAGNILREYTAVDDCGNTTSFTQVISLIDETAPEASDVPADVTVECDEEIPGGEPTFSDNCDEELDVTYEETVNELDCFYEIVQCWTAVDHCDNATTVCRTITVTDTTAPELEVAADLDLDCNDEIPAAAWEASDNCDEDLEEMVSEEIIEGNCAANYTLVRTYTVTDDCGNSTSMTQTITVSDTTAPSLEVAADVTIECDEDVPAADWTASDDCSDITEEVSEEIIPGDCPVAYTLVRTYTVTDACGNATSAVQNITVLDTTAPELEIAADVTIECDQEVPAAAWTASDNCSEITEEVTEVTVEGDCPNNYTIERTYSVTDACGNNTTATQIITVQDTTAPSLEIAADVTIECDQDVPAAAWTASDNCAEELTEVVDEEVVEGDCPNNYTILRTYSVTDACGNNTSATQTITVQDTTAPSLEIAADVTIECDEEVPAAAWTASDNCSDELEEEVTEVIVDGDCPNNYTIERTYSVTDACGNNTSATQIITVQDTTAPSLEVAADVTIECTDEIPAAAWEASDNCSETTDMVEESIIDGDCPAEYTIVRTYTATDACGNSTSAVQNITVVDTTAPEFTFVPQGSEYSCDAEIPAFQAEAEDACSEVTVTSSEEVIPGDCPQSYSVIITWTATDACGNAAEAQTTYSVYDNEAPVILDDFSDLVFECADEVPDFTECNAVDNCDEDVEVTVSMEVINEDECGNYDAVVTCTAVDDCGNASSTSFVVTVLDETAPEFVEAPADLVLDCEDEVPAPAELTAVDNCGGEVSISYTEEQFGDVPNPDAVQDCNLISPISPYYNPDWALWLQGFPGGEYFTLLNGEFLLWEDNSATITGSVVAVDNPQAGFDFVVQLENGLDWEGWSTQDFPTGYKDDFGAAGDNYLDWMYFIINGDLSSLSGWGDLDGVELTIAHAPASYYYGYQLGIAANNVNSNYGSGGWIYYEGTVDGEPVEGAGDFAFDHDCCPDYSIVRTWCAVDCSGNETCVEQTITFEDLGDDEEVVFAPGSDLTDTTGDIDIMAIAPNPTNSNTTVKIGSKRTQTITLEVYDLSGRKVATLFNQPAEANVAYTLNFGADALESGVYSVRLSSSTEQVVEKLIVGK